MTDDELRDVAHGHSGCMGLVVVMLTVCLWTTCTSVNSLERRLDGIEQLLEENKEEGGSRFGNLDVT